MHGVLGGPPDGPSQSEGGFALQLEHPRGTFALRALFLNGRGSPKRNGSRNEGNIRIGKRGNNMIPMPNSKDLE